MSSCCIKQAGKVAWRYLRSTVSAREGAVGLEAELRLLSLCFLGESRGKCHLAEASRERSVRLTGFPIFPRTGFPFLSCDPEETSLEVLQAGRLGSAEWLRRAGSLLCPAPNHSPFQAVCLHASQSAQKSAKLRSA